MFVSAEKADGEAMVSIKSGDGAEQPSSPLDNVAPAAGKGVKSDQATGEKTGENESDDMIQQKEPHTTPESTGAETTAITYYFVAPAIERVTF